MMKRLLLNILTICWGLLLQAAPCNFSVSITKVDVDCFGNATGSASAHVTGTSGPYTYVWSTGETTSSISNLTAQTYFVKVTDALGCEVIEFVEVVEPPKLTISSQVEHVKCNGDNTGSVNIEASGGFGNLEYVWSDGSEEADNLNLYAGEYQITITDDNYCLASDTFIITQPKALSETHVIQHVLGYGLSDGAIDITVDGGVLPYRYRWYYQGNLVDTLEDIYDLKAGDYTANVTDFNQCPLTTTIRVTQPPKLENSYQVTDVNCKEGTDGSIDLTVVGGVPPYTYIWANSEIIMNVEEQDIDGLKKDNYYVTITDFNGISITDSMFVDEPNTIQASLIPTDANCYGSSDGSIALTVSGGMPPYTFLWSDQTTNQQLQDVTANDYSVLIVDNNGCSLTADATVGQPPEIIIEETLTHVTCKDQSDGEIALSVTGGIPGYDYVWSHGETTRDVADLEGGNYSITVIDQHNCPMSEEYFIQVPPYICIWIPSAFTPNGDGYNDKWDITNSYLYPDITVTVFNKEGAQVFADTGYEESWDGTFNGNNSPAGTYYYVVNTRNNDKPFTGTVTIVR